MKYIFEVENKDGKDQIKLDIILQNNYSNGTPIIVSKDEGTRYWDGEYNKLISETIDNMRLTVKEREEAYKNSKIFASFIFPNDNDEKMICE